MEEIRAVFVFIFGRILYPGIVLLLMGFLVLSGASVIARERSGRAIMERLAAAVLPAIVLVFIVAMKEAAIPSWMLWLDSPFGFGAGAVLSVMVLELRSRSLLTGVLSSFYVFFVFSLAAAIIYFFLTGFFGIIEPPLAGFVIAGCMHLIFRRRIQPVGKGGDDPPGM